MVAAAALPAGAWAADAELGEVTVRGTTDPQTLPTVAPGGQVAKGAGLGVLGQRDVMDTPFNITSYTAEGIANQNAATLMSVLEKRSFGALHHQHPPCLRITSPSAAWG